MTRDDSIAIPEREAIHREPECVIQKSSPRLSINRVEEALASARPRLLRLATVRGVAPDAIDDVVQETLLEAWQYLDRLRSPEHFDAWLDGICRNICRRWQQRQHKLQARHISLLSYPSAADQDEDYSMLDLPDPTLLDPAEELDRQDREILLDRALARLSPENRKAIEMCYLLELPQRETALRLGMTISALEARLYRARRQLQHILSSSLRADAETFGLAMGAGGDEITGNWRESREWCDMCGRHRLYGIFQPTSNGKVRLVMKCPECSPRRNNSAVSCFLPSREWRSFRPAIKRIKQWNQEFVVKRYQSDLPGICDYCGAENIVHLMSAEEYLARFHPGYTVSPEHAFFPHFVCQCHSCSHINTGCAWYQAFTHPVMRRFKERHPRSINESLVISDYAGSPAFHLRVVDVTSGARINAFIHPETVQVLAVIEE